MGEGADDKKPTTPDLGELGDRPLSRFFYEVSNHHELFQLADSYWEDFKKGDRSFAFLSPTPTSAKEKTILGIASYFDRNAFLRMAIVGQSMRRGAYRQLMAKSHSVEVDLGLDYGRHFHIDRLNNVDFLDFSSLCEIAKEAKDNFLYEAALKQLLDSYGLVLWDAPDLSFFKENPVLCFPMMLRVKGLTVVLKESGESIKKLKEIHEFFDRYGVKIKGHILESK